ncbi:MAG: fatty acid desaturase [Burkholderiales bacterium]|nr:fatty acid desaturase [Burkholderiales bacterium]
MANQIDNIALKNLYQHRWQPNLKIPLFYGIWIGLGAMAWNAQHWFIVWPCYVGMGYMQMGVVTFMHDGVHNVLFKARWKNWAFGIFAMVPLLISFIAFREDHLIHHRHNRTAQDLDAFMMGQRGVGDFIVFYTYALAGVLLTALQFIFIFPAQSLRGKKAAIHLAEMALHVAVAVALFEWVSRLGVAFHALMLWFWPIVCFSFFNSVRFVAEHYGTPWNAGQLAGTRTIISNRLNSWFWNNINYHIGHHVYPGVPWYNLQQLHVLLVPEIIRQNATVDKSYFAVFCRAMRNGPEKLHAQPEKIAAAVVPL